MRRARLGQGVIWIFLIRRQHVRVKNLVKTVSTDLDNCKRTTAFWKLNEGPRRPLHIVLPLAVVQD